MAFTVVLIPVSLVLALSLVVAGAVGWVAFGTALAAAVARRGRVSNVRSWQAAVGTVAFAGTLAVVATIPVVGPVAALIVSATGFGAVLVTSFGMRRFVPDSQRTADRGRP